MQKITLLLLVITFYSCNQNLKEQRKVTQIIEEAFKNLHPTAAILKWNDEPPIWEAKYKDGLEKGAVSFNNKAEVVETELVISESQLPNASVISDYIKVHYSNEKIQGCEKITKQDGTNTYEIQITGKELVFDNTGKFLNEELD